MDYLTSFSQLFDCLLVLVCLSGNLTVFRLLDCIFDLCVVKAWVKHDTQIMIFIAHFFFVASKLHVNYVVLHMTGSKP